jgi:four helix bundle protein
MPPAIRSYRDLLVWQRGIDLAIECHRVADALPPVQRFGLGTQIRRAAGSVPANVAEGYGRLHRGEYLHHLSIANGSLKELETHLIVAERLGYLPRSRAAALDRLCWRTGRLLERLITALRDSPTRSPPGSPAATPPPRAAPAATPPSAA